MPPTKSKGRRSTTPVETASEAEKKPKAEKLNLGDSVALKRALDDAVVEMVQTEGWTLDYSLTDLKIGVGLSACLVACVGQFYPKKYAHHTLVLICCVVVYALLSAALTVIASLLERDIIALTGSGPGGGAPARLAIASRLPRFQDVYTLRIWPRGNALFGGHVAAVAGAEAKQPGELRLSKSVAAYFTADGYLEASTIKADVRQLLRQLEQAGDKKKD